MSGILAPNAVTFYRNDGKRWIKEGYKEFEDDEIEETDRIKCDCPVYLIHISFDYKTEEGKVKITPLKIEALRHPEKGLVALYKGESLFR